jgi:Uma2 family endonuclease
MTQAVKKTGIPPEVYLDMERNAEFRSEYYHGEVFAMTGASFRHNVIAGNIFGALRDSLRSSNCFVFMADMKVQAEPGLRYNYPDVMAVCGEIDFPGGRDDVIANPILIVEVLSKSTRDYDRAGKFTGYRNIAALRDFLAVDQYSAHVEHYSRMEDGWRLRDCKGMESDVILTGLELRLPLSLIYERVDFPEPTPEELAEEAELMRRRD